jgi:membrane protein YqaA with SNARE-associated domain
MWEWFEVRAKGVHAQAWLAAISFAESVFFPIPCDVLLIALLAARAGRWVWYAFITTLSSIAGAVFGYLLGLYVFEPVARPIIELYHLAEEFAHVGLLFEGSTFWVMLAAAVTPIPFKVFVLTGGFFAVPFLPFVVASIIGRGARFFLVAWLAHRYGPTGAEIGLTYFNRIALATLLAVAVWLAIHFDVFARFFS